MSLKEAEAPGPWRKANSTDRPADPGNQGEDESQT